MKSPIHILLLLVSFSLILCTGCTTPQKVIPPTLISDYQGQQNHDTFYNRDGLELYGQYWLPPKHSIQDQSTEIDPKAVVLIVHGTSLHSGVYDHVGKFLSSHGYAVYGTDLQGWGKSEGKGKHGFIENQMDYVKDIQLVLDRIEKRFPKKKVFVIGESLGANIALYGYLRGKTEFDGFIFSGAGYRPNPKLLGIRYPRFMLVIPTALSSAWGNVFPGWPSLPSDYGLSTVIKDKEVERTLKDDPLVAHNWIPASYISAFVKADQYNADNLEKVDIPILLFHGEKDKLVPIQSSQEIFDRVSSEDKSLRVLEDIHHATLIDIGRYQRLEEIAQWLEERK